jgi:hypothetical protein
LESYNTFDKQLAGSTFGCVIGANYENAMAGDAYFYSHKANPNQFTAAQIDAIEAFSPIKMICQNTNLLEIPGTYWSLPYVPKLNEKVSCKDVKRFDLSAWKI